VGVGVLLYDEKKFVLLKLLITICAKETGLESQKKASSKRRKAERDGDGA
jgi:hypothetical protein